MWLWCKRRLRASNFTDRSYKIRESWGYGTWNSSYFDISVLLQSHFLLCASLELSLHNSLTRLLCECKCCCTSTLCSLYRRVFIVSGQSAWICLHTTSSEGKMSVWMISSSYCRIWLDMNSVVCYSQSFDHFRWECFASVRCGSATLS